MSGIASIGIQFAIEQGISTGIAAGLCKGNKQEKAQCRRDALAQKDKEFKDYAESLVGIIGGELLEYFLKELFEKMVTKTIAKTATQASMTIGTKIAVKVGNLVVKLISKISTNLANKIAAKIAAKQAANAAGKTASKAAMGPVGWALLVFDIISLGLDLWDPLGFNETFYNKDLRGIRNDFLDGYRNAIDGADLAPAYKNLLTGYYHDIQEYEAELQEKQERAATKGTTYVDQDPDRIPLKPWYRDVKGMTYESIMAMKNKDLPESVGGPITFPLPAKPDFPKYRQITTSKGEAWFKDVNLTDVFSDAWYNSDTYKNWQKKMDEGYDLGTYTDRCLEAKGMNSGAPVVFNECKRKKEQKFRFTPGGQWKLDKTDLCVTRKGNDLVLEKCEALTPLPNSTKDDPQYRTEKDFSQRWGRGQNDEYISLKKDEALLWIDPEFEEYRFREATPERSCLTADHQGRQDLVDVVYDQEIPARSKMCQPNNWTQRFVPKYKGLQLDEDNTHVKLPQEYRDLRNFLKQWSPPKWTIDLFENQMTKSSLEDPELRQLWESEIEKYIHEVFTEERVNQVIEEVLASHGVSELDELFADAIVLDDDEAQEAQDGEGIGDGFVLSTDPNTGCKVKLKKKEDGTYEDPVFLKTEGAEQVIAKIDPTSQCPYRYHCESKETSWGPADGADYWVESTDDEGRPYYINCTTRETSRFPNGIDPTQTEWIEGVQKNTQCRYRYQPSSGEIEIEAGADGGEQVQEIQDNLGCRYRYNCATKEQSFPEGPIQWVPQTHEGQTYYINCQTQETSWFPNGVDPNAGSGGSGGSSGSGGSGGSTGGETGGETGGTTPETPTPGTTPPPKPPVVKRPSPPVKPNTQELQLPPEPDAPPMVTQVPETAPTPPPETPPEEIKQVLPEQETQAQQEFELTLDQMNVDPNATTPSPPTTTTAPPVVGDSSSGLSTTQIGVMIGSIFVVLFLIFLIIFMIRKRRSGSTPRYYQVRRR